MRWILILAILLTPSMAKALEIKSDSFLEGESIPTKYACDADNLSPQLSWNNPPLKTETFVLICEDPDAPSGIWSHWVVFNIPKEKSSLKEGIPTIGAFDDGMIQGRNSSGKIGYEGPCPPPGNPHRYFFKLYALDVELLLDEDTNRDILLKRISGHILAQAQIYGTYQR